MNAAEAAPVELRVDGCTLHLTLNRPKARNALSLAMVAELRAALEAAEAGGAIRVVVLRGAGGHFCSGGDLNDMAVARAAAAVGEPDAARQSALRAISAAFGGLCAAFARSTLATVGVLEGTVMGGGFGLACAVDVVLGSTDVSFRLPETSLGVVPAQVAPYLVERIGYSQARRLAVSGGRVEGPAALALGLVHELHAPAQLDGALARVLAEILACAPGAIASTKSLLARSLRSSPAELIDAAARTFAEAVLGEEGTEGTMAFLQRRAPRWAPQ